MKNSIEQKVGKIGYEDESSENPVAMIDKVTRRYLGIEDSDGNWTSESVTIRNGSKRVVASVGRQFKEFVGKRAVTLNTVAARKLGVRTGKTVTLDFSR